MTVNNESSTMIQFVVHLIPANESLLWTFDGNKKLLDLKNDLEEKHKMKKDKYYIEMNDRILNDDIILRDSGVTNDNDINIVRNDYIKYKLRIENEKGEIQIIRGYLHVSDFKIMKANENKELTNEEIKLMICLLKDESSETLLILEDLNKLLDKINDRWLRIGEMFLQMDFLSSLIKILENEKEDDEKIMNMLVIILRKMNDKCFKKENTDLYKSIDSIDSLYDIIINCSDNKIKEDAVKAVIIISKKYPSDVINNKRIKDSYEDILPSNDKYSDESKKFIYILFKELIKEGIIKKGEEGLELIEEILFIAEMTNNKKDIFNFKEELIKEINNYIIIGQEKGFESKVWNNKNEILTEACYIEWIELCKVKNNNSDASEEEIMKEEEEVKKFCNYLSSYSFSIQMKFIYNLHYILYYSYIYKEEFKLFESRKNGLFLYSYLPLLFKMYHFEEILPIFFEGIQDDYGYNPKVYKYLIELYNEFIERMIKEEKEIEINEKNVVIIMFLWSIIKEEGKKEKEIEYLIHSTLKIFEWLGKIKEEKEEEIPEKEKEMIQKENKKEESIKENINRKEIIIFHLVDVICRSLSKSKEDEEKVKKDGRISEILIEMVKNHIKKEGDVIEIGNKKRIIKYIIYSYYKDVDTLNLLSLPSSTFPFSHNTIVDILWYCNKFFTDCDNNELIKKDIIIYTVKLLNCYMDIIKIIEECDIQKEIEREILIEWNNNIIKNIKKKISFKWWNVRDILSYNLYSMNISSFDNENDNIIKRMINMYFNHNFKNSECNNYKEKENDNKDINESILIKPFIIDKQNREEFINCIVSPFTEYDKYSILNVFYLINKLEEGCDIINIYVKELSGEIVDRIKKKEGNEIRKERRRYERERIDDVYKQVFDSLEWMTYYTFNNRKNIYLGSERNIDEYKGKEKEIKEDKDYLLDIIEEEDMKECLILYLKHKIKDDNDNIKLYDLSIYSNNILYYLLFVNILELEWWML